MSSTKKESKTKTKESAEMIKDKEDKKLIEALLVEIADEYSGTNTDTTKDKNIRKRLRQIADVLNIDVPKNLSPELQKIVLEAAKEKYGIDSPGFTIAMNQAKMNIKLMKEKQSKASEAAKQKKRRLREAKAEAEAEVEEPKASGEDYEEMSGDEESEDEKMIDKAQEDIAEGPARVLLEMPVMMQAGQQAPTMEAVQQAPTMEAVQQAPAMEAPKMETQAAIPAKPSEINVLTKEEMGQTAKDLADYIGKKPNKKTEMMVNEIGGFKAYQELKAKYKLKNIYKSELVADELNVNVKDYNPAELGVLYNCYLMNKFEIKEVGGFKVGAVIDLKSLIGRQFTLKDLLSTSISGSAPAAVTPAAPMPPTPDINVGPVQRVEITGKETAPAVITESVRILQPDRVEQKLINPDVNIESIINKFPGSHTHQVPKVQQLTEDTKGNIVKYDVNVISKKKKLHFWDRV